jgi:hypothetical protein
LKVIFLDVDGVLNSIPGKSFYKNELNDHQYYIEKTKVKLLSKIVKKTGAAIVLHSGWRFFFDDELNPVCEESRNLIDILKKYGLEIYDKTPDLTTDEIRESKKFSLVKAQEILLWLQRHKGLESFIVLDDLDLHNEIIAKMQVRTEPYTGLSKKDVGLAIKKLKDGLMRKRIQGATYGI